ncbi:cytochrome P450 [Mycena olivaceomarginata]|nr:cytochrome P450 [Mycena olivaceomarginata]
MELPLYAIAFAALISVTVHLLFRQRSSIRQIVGPPSPSWLFGHTLQLRLSPQYGDHEFQWLKQFGSVYRLKTCFGQDQLMVADPLALQYILNGSAFERSGMLNVMVDLIFGEKSVVASKGNEHRRLRAALNVGFTATAVRRYQPIFEKMAETILEQLDNSPAMSTDIFPHLTNATLGAISEALFGTSIEDLGEEFVETSFQTIELSASRFKTKALVDALGDWLPIGFWRAATYLPTTTFRTIRRGSYLANQIGRQIVRDRLDAARQGLEMNDDLFSLMLNPDVADKISGDDIIAQMRLIFLAGQDTTATTVAFGLLELARNPAFQEKLRAEIQDALGTSAVAYDGMPLLNAFIKETIRLYPALPISDRIAVQDTTIPLTDQIITSTGERMSHIPVLKGQHITLCNRGIPKVWRYHVGVAHIIDCYHLRVESRWGPDSHEFNPFRWLNGAEFRTEAVGPYANLLSFFGGPHTCLGVLQMQVIIFQLVAKFSFAQVEGELVQPRFLTGEKAVPLSITRIRCT